jgi:hypothetical protein
MAKRDENVMRVDASPETVVGILTSEEYHEERERSKGALSVRFVEGRRTDDRLEFDVETEVHARGLTGVDRSKRERQSLHYTWDLAARTGRWTFHSSHGARVKVWGSVKVEPDGKASRVTNDFNVDVKIPVVGGQVEKKIMSEVAKGWAKYERTLRGFVERKSG